jgi:hypothetical protein
MPKNLPESSEKCESLAFRGWRTAGWPRAARALLLVEPCFLPRIDDQAKTNFLLHLTRADPNKHHLVGLSGRAIGCNFHIQTFDVRSEGKAVGLARPNVDTSWNVHELEVNQLAEPTEKANSLLTAPQAKEVRFALLIAGFGKHRPGPRCLLDV